MGRLDAARLADCDVLVNLAGASIAAGRWTERRKALIRESFLASGSTPNESSDS